MHCGTCRQRLFIELPAKCQRGEVADILASCQQPLKQPVNQVWSQSPRPFPSAEEFHEENFHGLISRDISVLKFKASQT